MKNKEKKNAKLKKLLNTESLPEGLWVTMDGARDLANMAEIKFKYRPSGKGFVLSMWWMHNGSVAHPPTFVDNLITGIPNTIIAILE